MLATASFAFGGDVAPKSAWTHWNSEEAVPIRPSIHRCASFLVPKEAGNNTSVGIPLTNEHTGSFADVLREIRDLQGRASLEGGKIFLTGIAMGEEAEAKALHEEILRELSLDDASIELRILSVPKKPLEKSMSSMLKYAGNVFRYLFFSKTRDYEPPTVGEVTAGLGTTVAIEIPNAILIASSLPLADAALTLGVHTGVLAFYMTYSKSLSNWLLRGSHDKRNTVPDALFRHSVSFAKQSATASPFVFNYSVLAHFTELSKYILSTETAQVLAEMPGAVGRSLLSDLPTLFLHTLFYTLAVTYAVEEWKNNQKGYQNSKMARTMYRYFLAPILAAEAMVLSTASRGEYPIGSYGPMEINAGHLALMGFAAAGSLLMIYPKIMDPLIPLGHGIAALSSRAAEIKKTVDEAKWPPVFIP